MKLSEKQILKIIEIIEESGEVAKKAFLNKNFIVNYKEDKSPVSNVDIELGVFITNALKENFPQIKVICEEDSEINSQLGQDNELFWLLDPIDGTSSFVGNSDEFAINLALVKNGKAIFGIIYAPLFMGGKMLFTNHLGLVVNKDKNNICNILPTLSNNYNQLNELRILVSTKTKDQQIEDFITKFFSKYINKISIIRLSSAVKFIYLAENNADIYLHLRKSMAWDTASGQAIIEAMSGRMFSLESNQEKSSYKMNQFSIEYDANNLVNPCFLVSFINNLPVAN
ncbi:MAG: hypothetical protein LW595_06560 [Rickettsiales bacterium]|nr:hypothetical protein [Rickettsiales bacterium]